MGSRGPIPKRSTERRRRNKESQVEKVKAPVRTRPPLAGRGSSTAAWRTYAESLGLEVPIGAGRDEILSIVDGDAAWHRIARDWYRSLAESGQSQFFEPSDWVAARYVAESMSRSLRTMRFSAQLFAAVWSAMTDLLTTEGARRRVRLEVERGTEEETPAKVTALDEYRKTLGA